MKYKHELLNPFLKVNYILKTLDNKDFVKGLSYKDKKYYKTILNGGAPIGQLTRVGEEQMFKLGRRIRQKYIQDLKFISSRYDPKEI